MIIMKKVTSLLIGGSLGLAGAALAQQPVEQQSPSKGKRAPEKAHPAQAQPKPNPAKPEAAAARTRVWRDTGPKQHGAMKEHGVTNEPGVGKGQRTPENQESATAPKTNDSADTSTPSAGQQRIEQRRKGMKGQAAVPTTSTNPAAGAAAGPGAASSVPAAGQQNVQANAGAKGKKPDPQ